MQRTPGLSMSIGVGIGSPVAGSVYAILSYRPVAHMCDKPITAGGPIVHRDTPSNTLFNTNWYLNAGNRCNPGAQEIPPHIKTH